MTQIVSPLQPHSVIASGKRIAFIQSGWHPDIVEQCRLGFYAEAARHGIPETLIDRFDVPGAFEIPLQAKLLAKTYGYAAIVAAALVVDGGIYRHDFVAQSVLNGLMQVQLETETPVFSAVLTPHHFHEHEAHRAFFHEHMFGKGEEVARACAQILDSLAIQGRPKRREA
jgi:6,7-dimethyl-8-ribityllumazine synthase